MLKLKIKYYSWVLLGLIIVSCNDNEKDCFVSAGETTSEFRGEHTINFIEVYDDINLILTYDTVNSGIIVETGKNLLENIETKIEKNRLTLRNNSTCNWVRSFEVEFNVYVNIKNLDTLIYRGSGNISCTDTLFCDSLQLDIWEGAGTVNLNINSGKSWLYNHQGTVDLIFTGKSGITFISSKGYGPINCSGLESNIVYLYTISPNHCYINSRAIIDVTIDNIGNVYYTGNPYAIFTNYNSTGKLIKLE